VSDQQERTPQVITMGPLRMKGSSRAGFQGKPEMEPEPEQQEQLEGDVRGEQE
jgi:hypothetical protein